MKASTKRKIIYWIIKVLKYQETYQPFIVEKRREIQAIHWTNIYNKKDWELMVQNEMIKYHAVSGIANELQKGNAIDIKVEPVHPDFASDDSMRVHAILKYILP